MKIAIASGKGGTGKTTLSTNLADLCAERKDFPGIILADMDVEEPNSGLFIQREVQKEIIRNKMIPQWDKDLCSNCGVCDSICRFNSLLKLGKTILVMPELCHSCYACSELCPENALPMQMQKMGRQTIFNTDSFIFIESRLDVGQEQAVPLIAQSIEYIDSKYPKDFLVLLDSPPGSSCPVIEAAKNSDFVILVTEPTPFGLHDLKMAVNTMREIKKDFAVVINRFGIGNDAVIRYCSDEKIDIIAKLPDKREIAELYSKGKLVHRDVPEFGKELKKVAKYLKRLSDRRNNQ
ncbi:MAG: ATP-binding protein [Spirochaetales bacterium]|nr:ATP-binding protein [Spirochaetales bacterium]